MDLRFSEEQTELRKTLARLLEERAALASVRAVEASEEGHDVALHRTLAELAKSSPTPDVIQAAGWALLIQDRAPDALALLRPLAESDAADESLLIQGAEAAARCGDFASTERYLQRVIQRDPGEEHAYEPLLGLYAAGAPLADESKLAATVRGLREAAPLGRTIRMATAGRFAAYRRGERVCSTRTAVCGRHPSPRGPARAPGR